MFSRRSASTRGRSSTATPPRRSGIAKSWGQGRSGTSACRTCSSRRRSSRRPSTSATSVVSRTRPTSWPSSTRVRPRTPT
eukprot:14720455-Alexandrium_andersonii.AAC.1